MIDSRARLSVLTSTPVADVETFTDYTEDASDYARDPFTITLADTDYLYLGYRKPFGAAYVALDTANATTNTLAFEYWNGSEWSALSVRDNTKGLTQAGWFLWDKPTTDWAATEINSQDLFWVRALPSDTHTATVVAGLNLVFADDYDLMNEFSNIRDDLFLPDGRTSHLLTHVACRNRIIQDLRDKGYIKRDSAGTWSNITPWDLHDIEEVRQAAVYLALNNIFAAYSDNPQDTWANKAARYEGLYKSTLSTLKVSVDANDDGIENVEEQVPPARVTRLYR